MGVHIEVWSDFACPWCALGIYRLDRARAEFEHGGEITVRHRSFELDPRAPARRTQTMAEVLALKYGMSPEQVHAGHADIIRESLDGATCWALMAAAEGWDISAWE